ncbi:MAG: LCP family protein [Lachnospiraceae bacterium]
MARDTRKQTEYATGRSQGRPSGKSAAKKNARKKRKIALLVAELLIVAILLGVLALFWFLESPNGETPEGEKGGPLFNVSIKEDDLQINEQVQENENLKEYRNIALFGVDSRKGALTKGTLSDCIIIASINLQTHDVKLVSVYRDTYLNLSNDKYGKCNSAYSYGGAEQAMKMLNMNLDLDIKDFVTIGFDGLTQVIDDIGGISLDVDEEELRHINSYQECMAKDMGISYTPVTQTGYQLLNGLQATAYCRVRYKTGNDFARAASQREVIQAIVDKVKTMDVVTLTKVANDVSNNVYTSLSMDEIVSLLGEVSKYNIVDEGGFPEASMRGSSILGSKGSCVYPINLKENVTWLHEFLFNDTNYEPSKEVQEYSKIVHDFVSQYTNID